MQLTTTIFQSNSIESVPFANPFSTRGEFRLESDSSTAGLDGAIFLTPSIASVSLNSRQAHCMGIDGEVKNNIQVNFLRTAPDNSMQELWFVLLDDNRKKTSWIPSEDKVDEIRELAIKSLCHSMDIGIDLSGMLLNFCYRHKLMEYVKTSIDLVKTCFPSYKNISAEFVEDMESDEQWILINVFVRDKIDRILDMYDKYTEEWIDKVPWPESSKIRISYHPIK